MSSFQTILRAFQRERAYALINLFGLSLAIACCIILGLYLRSELTYDQHHTLHERIYRVANEFTLSGPPDPLAETPIPIGALLDEQVPEIEAVARYWHVGNNILVRGEDKALFRDDIYAADPSALDMFTHEIVYGDTAMSLRDPGSIAISESFAREFFGDTNPIGETLLVESYPIMPRRISMVFKDLPENTHLKYSLLLPIDEPPNFRPLLFNVTVFTYVLMPENYDVDRFPGECEQVFDHYMAEEARRRNISWRCWLEPLDEIHLNSNLLFDLPTGNIYYIYGFTAVALFILLVACINYVNLAIARATKRAREIGMRKILGASRRTLALRFLGEALVFAFLAVLAGVVIVKLALAYAPVSYLLGKPLELDFSREPVLVMWLLVLGSVIGVLAGAYPALYLSTFSPLSALVASLSGRPGGFRLRELLVLVQFMVSVIVIASTMVMALQMRYITSLPMGFEAENRIVVNLQGLDVIENFRLVKDELMTDSRIQGVSHTWAMISTDQMVPLGPGQVANREGVMETTSFGVLAVEEDFLDVMGIELLEGRDFSQRYLTDVGAGILVNEAMVKHQDWEDPLGMPLAYGNVNGRVVGVVKDFLIQSARHDIWPVAMWLDQIDFDSIPREARGSFRRLMVVKLSGQDVSGALSFIEQTMSKFDPDNPFVYTFLDESVGSLYQSDDRLMQMTGIFSVICIFISCLGLFGLTAFSTEQRRKEIGIRKVLGATTMQVILVLARKILWLVIAGSIVASVIAWFTIDEWLAGFAYRIDIRVWVFLLAAVIVTLVAYFTVALQSWRAAQANPTLSIRHE